MYIYVILEAGEENYYPAKGVALVLTLQMLIIWLEIKNPLRFSP